MKVSGWIIYLTAYILFFAGLEVAYIGTISKPYMIEWYHVILIFIILVIPAKFGYEAGIEEAKED